jgi:hypothetical protein
LALAAPQAPGTPQHPPRRPYIPETVSASGGPVEIHVDDRCRILPDPAQPLAAKQKKPRPLTDPIICHVEGTHTSTHGEEAMVGNLLERSLVTVFEQEYVLQNISPDPVVFVAEQPVQKDWQVDSDPAPQEIVGSTAMFHVHAAPGEIVRLHVGLRHAKPLKPKQIGRTPVTPSTPPAPSTGN